MLVTRQPLKNEASRAEWVDYLRSFITILVVAHHAALAYPTFAWFDREVYINSTHAIVDSQRWVGLDIFINFNDIFFMSLMFLIGGLFLVKSIRKKGGGAFIRDRFYRLFIPFMLGGTSLMLLAYYPSYYEVHGAHNIPDYIHDFFTLQRWPVGPPWFIWVLFLFNLIFAFSSPWIDSRLNQLSIWISRLKTKPIRLFVFWSLFTWVLYVPLAFWVGAGTWTGIGPFDFQLSRILLYFGYFMLGVVIGNSNFNSELFSSQSTIVRRWWVWALLAFLIFCLLTIVSKTLTDMVKEQKIQESYAWMIYFVVFVSSCTLSCIAFISSFKALVRSPNFWWNSLSENAYLIYLIHFVFVTWCQFILLEVHVHAFAKFIITFLVAMIGSWVVSRFARKIYLIRKYI